MNYYDLLSISMDASNEEIKSAYLELAKVYHPDSNSAKNANYLFSEIKEAYDTLKNPILRNEYNQKITFSSYKKEETYKQAYTMPTYDNTNCENTKYDSNNNSHTKQNERSPWRAIFVIFVIFSVLLIYIYSKNYSNKDSSNEEANKEQSIALVRYYNQLTFNEAIEVAINKMDGIYKIYGWESNFIEDTTYLVTYSFDDDDDKSNGYKGIYYEVELSSETVRPITSNKTLKKKYMDLGYIID